MSTKKPKPSKKLAKSGKKKKTTDRQSQHDDALTFLIAPSVSARILVNNIWDNFDIKEADIESALCAINEGIIFDNNNSYIESMLLNQVHVLNGIFMKLSAKSLNAEYINQMNS